MNSFGLLCDGCFGPVIVLSTVYDTRSAISFFHFHLRCSHLLLIPIIPFYSVFIPLVYSISPVSLFHINPSQLRDLALAVSVHTGGALFPSTHVRPRPSSPSLFLPPRFISSSSPPLSSSSVLSSSRACAGAQSALNLKQLRGPCSPVPSSFRSIPSTSRLSTTRIRTKVPSDSFAKVCASFIRSLSAYCVRAE